MLKQLQSLLRLEVADNGGTFYFQNYQHDPLNYDGQNYLFLGFQVESYPSSSLEIEGQQATIWINNAGVIPGLIRQYDALRRSIVTLTHLIDTLPVVWTLQVYSTTFRPGYTVFELNTPTSALQGPLVSRYLNSVEHPELLYVQPQQNAF